MILYVAALAALFTWRFRSGRWRTIVLVEPDVAVETVPHGVA
jgi:hypothetical protein